MHKILNSFSLLNAKHLDLLQGGLFLGIENLLEKLSKQRREEKRKCKKIYKMNRVMGPHHQSPPKKTTNKTGCDRAVNATFYLQSLPFSTLPL